MADNGTVPAPAGLFGRITCTSSAMSDAFSRSLRACATSPIFLAFMYSRMYVLANVSWRVILLLEDPDCGEAWRLELTPAAYLHAKLGALKRSAKTPAATLREPPHRAAETASFIISW
eukprot:CAMPEP_0194539034 /NCGR_PEP_ID=MMETSP0253-20130528/78851_1 /TAXON_ID=2966 /ORGANISM="Noctiluca scintillans" /LENGTH=117 /DNA_ID=CAMNT_0039385247 /DNA_START=288 /DNA_END=638 /DNA_ORIENTATION=-